MANRVKAIHGIPRYDPKKEKLSFLTSYESLFTSFPQMWIIEIINQRGEK